MTTASRPAPRGPYVRGVIGALRYRLTGHRMPLALTARVTWRCDASCSGCGMPNVAKPELTTAEWVAVLDEAAQLGCVRVCFTGGEPLLREDIGDLVDRCATLGLATTLETNGGQLVQRARFLASLGQVVVAVEGGEAAHDALHEVGSYASAVAGLQAAQATGIAVSTVTSLCVCNRRTSDLESVISLAESLGGTALFQVLHSEAPVASRAARRLRLEPEELRGTLGWLLDALASGRSIGMSVKTLRYLQTWPDLDEVVQAAPHEDVHCSAGNLHCVVDADGSVLPCILRPTDNAPNVLDGGFSTAFDALLEQPCRACAIAPLVEYNYLLNLNRDAVLARLSLVRSPISRSAA